MYFHQRLSLLLGISLLLLSVQPVAAQKKKEKRDDDFKSRLWYGGGFGLGFSSGPGFSVFQFGLAPQVGYKIVEPLSVGPRVAFSFSSYKEQGFKSLGLFNVDAGLFVRFRVFRGLFLQAEGSNEWYQTPDGGVSGNRLTKESRNRFNKRIGAGWNWSGGSGGGTEIAILYNFTIAEDLNTFEQPWDYRFGFTWNF
jgi:hypothetical protein